MNQFVEIRKSKRHGKGVFALKDFQKGEKVYSYEKGRIIIPNEIKNLSKREKIYLDKTEENEYEIVESPGRYINHSCDSNVKERNRTGYAMKNIRRGEEITIDYDKTVYLEEPFKCHCGSEDCRGLIRGRKGI